MVNYLLLITLVVVGVPILLLMINKPVRLLYTIVLVPGLVDLLWDYELFGISVLDIFYGGFFLIAIFVILLGRRARPNSLGREYSLIYVAFFFPIVFPLLNGDYLTGLNLFVKISYGLIAYLLVIKYLKLEDRDKFIRYVSVGVIISLVVFAYQLISGVGVGYSQYTYGTGFYSDEGTLSRKAIYAIILFFPFKGSLFYKYKAIYFSILIFAFAVLGLSVSRNAILAAMVVVAFYLFYKKSFISFTLLVIASSFLISVDYINQGLYNKVEKEITYLQGGDVNVETLGSGRIGRWTTYMQQFDNLSTEEKLFGTGRGIGPHGQFLDNLSRGGVFTLVIFIIFFGRISFYVFKNLKELNDDYISIYLVQFLLVFWVLSIGATPFYNFQLLIILFSLYAVFEKMLVKRNYLANKKNKLRMRKLHNTDKEFLRVSENR